MSKFKKGNKAAEGKNIETPEKLWEYFKEYQKINKQNPRYINQLCNRTGAIIPVPFKPPLTWEGFECLLADKDVITTLNDYKSNRDNRYKSYVEVITRIRNELFKDKFEGASIGLYKENIIARDLGLKDRQDFTSKDNELNFNESILKRNGSK